VYESEKEREGEGERGREGYNSLVKHNKLN